MKCRFIQAELKPVSSCRCQCTLHTYTHNQTDDIIWRFIFVMQPALNYSEVSKPSGCCSRFSTPIQSLKYRETYIIVLCKEMVFNLKNYSWNFNVFGHTNWPRIILFAQLQWSGLRRAGLLNFDMYWPLFFILLHLVPKFSESSMQKYTC